MNDLSSNQVILAVDDDPFVRQLLYELLADLGTVVLAESGEDALQKAVSVDPDVIILDVEMPGLNGYEVCNSLKSSETTSEIPIIFLTANDSDEDEEMALNCGAADFIRKPISGKILTTRVANVLRVRSAERQLRDSEARYRLIASMQSELVTRFSPDGVFTYANAAYCEFVKKPERRLIGTSIFADAPPKDRAALKDYLASFSRDQRVQHNENQLIRHDGSLRDIEWSNFAQFGDDGQLIEFQSVGRDITERKQIEATLVASEARYAAVVDSQSELITRFKPSGAFTFVNEAYCRFVGRSESDVLAGTIFDDVSGDHVALLKKFVSSFSVSKPVGDIENKLRRFDGQIRDFEWHDTAYFDDQGGLIEIQSVARDVTDRNLAERALQDSRRKLQETVEALQEREKQLEITTRELEILATTDPLTGAYNRRHFLTMGNVELHRSQRYESLLSVLMLDIDHFKAVNDTFGHGAGDEALKETVRITQNALRDEDTLGRLGGEEFGVILPESGTDNALHVAERIRASIAEIVIDTDQGPLNFTISIGMAETTDDDADIEAALERADKALYEAKNQGRNRVISA